ncbi:MAG: ribosomal protein L11 methyltransferase [uncultured bacterium]|nr:MAG: ribosomal protein L11 methyltransferase [uncultured bacterium]
MLTYVRACVRKVFVSTQKQQNWLEAKWLIDPSNTELFQERLEQYGSLGSYENLPMEPTGQETDIELISYFPDTADVNALAAQLQSLENNTTRLLTVKKIPQGNWATEWKKYFKPFLFADNIVIRPSWEPYTPKQNEIVLTIDPGMAFGTGQHDTTQFCASLICKIKKQRPELSTLIDVGCGSGILSLLASLIGFQKVVGFDVDETAIETAFENLEKNPSVRNVDFRLSKGTISELFLHPADVVAANIIAETLVELRDDLVSLVAKNGCLILSGILPDKDELIKKSFSDLVLCEMAQSQNWYAYLYCKK